MKALCLWDNKYQALSDINVFFTSIIYRTEFSYKKDSELLEEVANEKIDYVLIQNPYLNPKRLNLYRKLKSNKVKCIISDRGALPNSWFFDPNGFNADSSSYHPKNWDKPLSEIRDKRVTDYITSEISQQEALEQQGEKIGFEELRKKLLIDEGKKVLFVPLQRPSDTVIKYFSGRVSNMDEFLSSIIEVQKELSDEWVILVKKHPLEVDRPFEDQLNYVDDDTHFKDLLQLCDAVALINSGVGVHAMMHQKPVFYFGDIFYAHPDINRAVANAQNLIEALNANLPKVNFEKVKRFISYLIEDFYSFGEFVTELVVKEDGSKITATRDIHFKSFNGLPNCAKPISLMVTDIDFWQADLGSRVRVLSLVKSLQKNIPLKILYIKKFNKDDRSKIQKLGMEHLIVNLNDIEVSENRHLINDDSAVDCLKEFFNQTLKSKFDKYLKKKSFKNIIFEYIKLHYFTQGLNGNYCKIIDTHDLMSLRTESYSKNSKDKIGLSIAIDSFETEVEILDEYDFILSIQKREYEILKQNTKANKNILVPHSIGVENLFASRSELKNIIFISGAGNLNHIVWFLEKVWRFFAAKNDLKLNIVGSVCSYLNRYSNVGNLNLVGSISELKKVYNEADLAINPVQYGSGLKIKNVEALAYGIPLITTDEGANGIEDGIDYAFLLANTPDEWVEAILSLMLSKDLRETLSKQAMKYAHWHFNEEVAYRDLVHVLEGEK